MSVVIDEYQPRDRDRLRSIAPRAFSQFTRYGLDFMLPKDRVDEWFIDEVEGYCERAEDGADGFAVFVARRDDVPLGYIVLSIDAGRSEHFGLKWGKITSLAVDPDVHHQGIGSALIQRAMDWFSQQECEYIEVATDQNNIAAMRAYEKANFRAIYCAITLSQKLSS